MSKKRIIGFGGPLLKAVGIGLALGVAYAFMRFWTAKGLSVGAGAALALPVGFIVVVLGGLILLLAFTLLAALVVFPLKGVSLLKKRLRDSREDKLFTTKGIPAEAAARNEDPKLRRAALRALGGRAAIEEIAEALKDPDKEVAEEATYVLRKLGQRARSAIPQLAEIIEKNASLRVKALNAVKDIGLTPEDAELIRGAVKNHGQWDNPLADNSISDIGKKWNVMLFPIPDIDDDLDDEEQP